MSIPSKRGAPNPRVQRTRSSASRHRAPLTRHPLGGRVGRRRLMSQLLIAAALLTTAVSAEMPPSRYIPRPGPGDWSPVEGICFVLPEMPPQATCPIHGTPIRLLEIRMTGDAGDGPESWPGYGAVWCREFPLADFDWPVRGCMGGPEYASVHRWCCVECVKARNAWAAAHNPFRSAAIKARRP